MIVRPGPTFQPSGWHAAPTPEEAAVRSQRRDVMIMTCDDGLVLDPVCEQVVDAQFVRYSRVHKGKRYFFCCDMCLAAFVRSPGRYADARYRGPYL
jgi:YHS domain-containing protein